MTAAIFIDTSNMYFCSKREFGRNINYLSLLQVIQETLQLTDIVARSYGTYVGQKPLTFIHNLTKLGIIPNYKPAREVCQDTYKADCDVDIAVEVFKQINNFETFVLCSADGDFAPLIEYLLSCNKKVFVFGINISNELKALAPCYELKEEVTEHEIAQIAK